MAWLIRVLLIAGIVAQAACIAAPAGAVGPVVVLEVDGPIGPATADYVRRGLEKAAQRQAQLVVLRMDTPGGLDASMREIVKDILGSPVPVAAFVAPGGARAASAGTYILYASHIAAMAPATNLGAATPVQIGAPSSRGTPEPGGAPNGEDDGKSDAKKEKPRLGRGSGDAMTAKQISDAAAYIRGLAQLRGRNADWAERAVREAESLPAHEALRQGVIDLIARDVPDLLAKLDGRAVTLAAGMVRLQTAGAAVDTVQPDWRTKLLAVITNPSVALILMMVGVYGLFFEFSNPGFVLPGVVGAICLLLALFALNMLPVNYAGLGLILLGLALMIAEVFAPSFGALGIGGAVAFVLGAVFLIDSEVPGLGIPLALIVAVALTSALFIFLVGGMAVRARRRPVVSGREELAGSRGEVVAVVGPACWARVHGENWQVRSAHALRVGDTIRVVGMHGLILDVVPDRSQPDEG